MKYLRVTVSELRSMIKISKNLLNPKYLEASPTDLTLLLGNSYEKTFPTRLMDVAPSTLPTSSYTVRPAGPLSDYAVRQKN